MLHRFDRIEKPPEVELDLVAQVEEVLNCRLPDEIIACFADDVLENDGFILGEIVDNTTYARKRRHPRDLIAVGRQELLAFYCISGDCMRHDPVQIIDCDNLDGSLNWYDLSVWLEERVESSKEFFLESATDDEHAKLAEWIPSPKELANFIPRLV